MFGPIERLLTAIVMIPSLLIWFGTSAIADDEKLPTTVAAVIDYQRILLESAASKSIAEQMESRRQHVQAEIGKEEQALNDANKALTILSEEAKKSKQEEIEAGVQRVRKLTAERRQQLEEISAEAVNEVKSALIEIVTGIAEERGFNLVLPSSQVLFFSRQIDLTDEVLSKLDARLSQVAVRDLTQ